MLMFWQQAGIGRTDLAVKRKDGAMLWHRDLPLRDLPLKWARAQNAQQGEIYLRPARGYSWPLLFLDDVPAEGALRVCRKYGALVVRTSLEGGCHIWLSSTRPLAEIERYQAQKWLAGRLGADPGSISGEHLGRLAGFKNWKRQGSWVNVLGQSEAPSWNPEVALPDEHPAANAPDHSVAQSLPGFSGRDSSPSGLEWGWVCGLLEAGCSYDQVHERLVEQARKRRQSDVDRYARRTIDRAWTHFQASTLRIERTITRHERTTGEPRRAA
jgi:hypothetical protein